MATTVTTTTEKPKKENQKDDDHYDSGTNAEWSSDEGTEIFF